MNKSVVDVDFGDEGEWIFGSRVMKESGFLAVE
jgi:hypothetical protein